MTVLPRAVLHIGGPKCGSSALQTVLSMQPRFTAPDGRRFGYLGLERRRGRCRPLEGEALRRAALRSPYGYETWPDLPPGEEADAVLDVFAEVLRPRPGDAPVPVLSSEGWISRPERFADALGRLGHPPVTVVAFVRPPLEWLNAAYWQWGVWHGLPFDAWLARFGMAYRFGTLLQRWSRIPGVALHVRSTRDDTVVGFGAVLGITLPGPGRGNASATPGLVGFLLRNRARFRPDAHDCATEFVVQRWCGRPPGRPLWALNHKDFQGLRAGNRAEVRLLLEVLGPRDAERLLADPRWLEETPYHGLVRAGRSILRETTDLPDLFDTLVAGLDKALAATGRRRPPLPPRPAPSADLETWDVALAPVMAALIEADAEWRIGRSLPWLKGVRNPFGGRR